jgi:hypothetical protein
MKTSMKLAIVAVVAAAFCASFAAGQWSQAHEIASLARRIANTERQLASLQESYLTGSVQSRQQLARSLGYVPAQVAKHDGSDTRTPPTAAESDAKRQRASVAIEREYASEPIDARWSGTTTQLVQDAIVDVAAGGAPMPQSAQVDCRSRTCRIALTLDDTAEIGMFTDNLLVGLAAKLPSTRMIEAPSPDGHGMTVSIYASKP